MTSLRAMAATAAAVLVTTTLSAAPAAAHQYHRVQRGDTLYEISAEYRVPMRTLAKRNGIRDVDLIFAGDRLLVRKGDHGKATHAKRKPAARRRGPIPAAGARTRHTSGYPWAWWSGDINQPGTRDCGNPVRATGPGTVTATKRWGYSYGKHVRVRHPRSRTLYAHLRAIVVRPGQRVARGQLLGRVGTTGNSSGCHLHFEKGPR